jgi:NADH-quinone oxidoreductase subunit J
MRAGLLEYAPIGMLVGMILFTELHSCWAPATRQGCGAGRYRAAVAGTACHNTAALGHILYTRYIFFFQMAGLVLLVAMIGAIVLTLRHKEGVKRQNISEHRSRARPQRGHRSASMSKPGQGI